MRDIGVSNFGEKHIERLLQTAKVVPAVNQVELSPFLQRKDLVAYCRSKGIALEVKHLILTPPIFSIYHKRFLTGLPCLLISLAGRCCQQTALVLKAQSLLLT